MERIAAIGVYALKNPGSVLIGDVLKSELERRLDNCVVDLYAFGDKPLWVFADPWDFKVTRKKGYEIQPFLSEESKRFVEKLIDEYHVIILGGDTIWSPHHPWPDLLWLDDKKLVDSPLTILSHATCIREPFHFLYDDRGIDYWRQRFERLCNRLQYISVRDVRSKQNLEDLGITKPIHVVPEPVLLYEKTENAYVGELLKSLGTDVSKPLVGVSLSSEIQKVRSNFLEELVKGIRHLRDARGCDILVFPYSPVHHQMEGIAVLLECLGDGVFVLDRFLDPWDTYDLIGNLALLIIFPGFHGLIGAIAQNVPVLSIDIYTSQPSKNLQHPRYIMGPCTKILQLIQTLNLEESYLNPYVHFEPNVVLNRLDFLLSSPRDISPRLKRVRKEIGEHFDRLADMIREADRVHRKQRVRGDGKQLWPLPGTQPVPGAPNPADPRRRLLRSIPLPAAARLPVPERPARGRKLQGPHRG